MRRPRFVASLFFVAAFALAFAAPSRASAAEHARLQVTREEGATECPDERALRDAVGARLGYEPFTADAPRLVVVTFRREGSGLRGVVELRDADGSVRGERTLGSARGDCEELASATTFTISILLDPRSGMVPARPPEAELTPDPAPALPPPPAAGPPAEAPVGPKPAAPERLRLRLTAGATGSVGSAPAPAVGVLVGVGVEHRAWSATAELRADQAASETIGVLQPRTSFVAGNLVPCGHFSRLYVCGVLTLGAISGEVLGASPSRQSSFHALIGPRVGVALPLVSWLSLDGHLDASYALTRTTLRAGDTDLWTTSTVSGLAGIGVAGRFP